MNDIHRLQSVSLAALALAAGCSTGSLETNGESAGATQSPSAAATATADPPAASIAGLPFTAVKADAAPSGALSVEMTGWTYVPARLTAKAGTVVIFLMNTTDFQKHNMNIGPAIGEPLVETPLVRSGDGLVLTIEGLRPGSYTFWDSVWRPEEKAYFYELGMVGTLTITP